MTQLTLDDLEVVEVARFTRKEQEESARGAAVLATMQRAILHMDLRRMTLEQVIEEWHIANGKEQA